METLIAVAALALLAAAASLFGQDSQNWDERDRRPWWPGRRVES